MKRVLLSFSAVTLACLFVAIPACGTAKNRSGFEEPGSENSDASGGFGLDGEAGGCVGSCSGDLHSILDCNGHVIETCAADKGCANSKCVGPCEAAAANKSSVGCDYLVLPPPFYSGSTSCTGAFIANTWGSPVTVTISRGLQSFSADNFAYLPSGTGSAITYAPLTGGVIPPGQVGLVLLNQEGAACPSGTKSATGPVAVPDTGMGEAFRLQTDAPVVAYDIFPYGGGSTAVSSATLLIPTTAWGDNYVGTTAYPETVGGGASPWLGMVSVRVLSTAQARSFESDTIRDR